MYEILQVSFKSKSCLTYLGYIFLEDLRTFLVHFEVQISIHFFL